MKMLSKRTPEQKQEKTEEDKAKANQLISDFQECFNSESGKRVLKKLEDYVQFESIVPLDMPMEQVKQLEGSRNVVVYIKNMLKKELV